MIKNVFRFYGFGFIEMFLFELFFILLGKYGEEGDWFIFCILNLGDKMKKVDIEAFQQENLLCFVNLLVEKVFWYDFIVFFVCFVVQYQNEIFFLFKCYQIQLVWWVDCLQYGCYQEFY